MANIDRKSVHDDDYFKDLEQVAKLFEVIVNPNTDNETRKNYCNLFSEIRLNDLLQTEMESSEAWIESFDFCKRALVLLMRMLEPNELQTKGIKQLLFTNHTRHSARTSVLSCLFYLKFFDGQNIQTIFDLCEACLFHNVSGNIYYKPKVEDTGVYPDTQANPACAVDLIYINYIQISPGAQALISEQTERYSLEFIELFSTELQSFLLALDIDYLSQHILVQEPYSMVSSLLYILDAPASNIKPVGGEYLEALTKFTSELRDLVNEKFGSTGEKPTDVLAGNMDGISMAMSERLENKAAIPTPEYADTTVKSEVPNETSISTPHADESHPLDLLSTDTETHVMDDLDNLVSESSAEVSLAEPVSEIVKVEEPVGSESPAVQTTAMLESIPLEISAPVKEPKPEVVEVQDQVSAPDNTPPLMDELLPVNSSPIEEPLELLNDLVPPQNVESEVTADTAELLPLPVIPPAMEMPIPDVSLSPNNSTPHESTETLSQVTDLIEEETEVHAAEISPLTPQANAEMLISESGEESLDDLLSLYNGGATIASSPSPANDPATMDIFPIDEKVESITGETQQATSVSPNNSDEKPFYETDNPYAPEFTNEDLAIPVDLESIENLISGNEPIGPEPTEEEILKLIQPSTDGSNGSNSNAA